MTARAPTWPSAKKTREEPVDPDPILALNMLNQRAISRALREELRKRQASETAVPPISSRRCCKRCVPSATTCSPPPCRPRACHREPRRHAGRIRTRSTKVTRFASTDVAVRVRKRARRPWLWRPRQMRRALRPPCREEMEPVPSVLRAAGATRDGNEGAAATAALVLRKKINVAGGPRCRKTVAR